jgi:CYTH domain-containing protein
MVPPLAPGFQHAKWCFYLKGRLDVVELEREKTYLLAKLPAHLDMARSEIIRDAFIPAQSDHPILRIRQRGERYEITKKMAVSEKDASRHEEHTIALTEEEFASLNTADAKRFAKRRYYCEIDGQKAEVDVYHEALTGLAIVDFEFDNDEAMAAFNPPSICLADVTQENTFAGGKLAGKTYEELKIILDRYNYKPLTSKEAL